MTIKQVRKTIEQVERFIGNHPLAYSWKVDVYTWANPDKYGIRVSEVSITKCNGGFSFMQDDPEAAKILFLAERLAIACFADDKGGIEELSEQLREEIFGENETNH